MPATKSPGKTARPAKAAGRFRIKRIYEPAGKDDGLRVLVDRLVAARRRQAEGAYRSVAARPVPQRRAAPHGACRPDKWDEFVKAYGRELKQEPARTALAELRKLLRSQPVTLLYAAREEAHNNAVALKRWLGRAK